MARDRRNYTDEFKQKMVELYNSGKPRAELVREYELTPSALASWIIKLQVNCRISSVFIKFV